MNKSSDNQSENPLDAFKQLVENAFDGLKTVLPENFGENNKDNIKAVLSRALQDMDFVTREELEVQNRVLLKTRLELERLQSIVENLEKR